MEVQNHSRVWTTNYEVIQSTGRNVNRCFACSVCNKCQAGKEIIFQGGNTYCWQCFENIYGLKCGSCSKCITGLSKVMFILYNGKVWHKECFRCSCCKKSLEREHFHQDNNSIYCNNCSDDKKFYIGNANNY